MIAVIGGIGYTLYKFFKVCTCVREGESSVKYNYVSVQLFAIPWLSARLEQNDRVEEMGSTVRQLQSHLDTTGCVGVVLSSFIDVYNYYMHTIFNIHTVSGISEATTSIRVRC